MNESTDVDLLLLLWFLVVLDKASWILFYCVDLLVNSKDSCLGVMH